MQAKRRPVRRVEFDAKPPLVHEITPLEDKQIGIVRMPEASKELQEDMESPPENDEFVLHLPHLSSPRHLKTKQDDDCVIIGVTNSVDRSDNERQNCSNVYKNVDADNSIIEEQSKGKVKNEGGTNKVGAVPIIKLVCTRIYIHPLCFHNILHGLMS